MGGGRKEAFAAAILFWCSYVEGKNIDSA